MGRSAWKPRPPVTNEIRPVKAVPRVERARASVDRRAGSLVRSNPTRALLAPPSGQIATIGTYVARSPADRNTPGRTSSEMRLPRVASNRSRWADVTISASARASVAPIDPTARAYAPKLASSTAPCASTRPAEARRLVTTRPRLFCNASFAVCAARSSSTCFLSSARVHRSHATATVAIATSTTSDPPTSVGAATRVLTHGVIARARRCRARNAERPASVRPDEVSGRPRVGTTFSTPT